MKINDSLRKYIEENIFPEYEKNDEGHKLDHIMSVIRRSFDFASRVENINYDMVYTIAAYHDVAIHIDRKNHEKLSGEILSKDDNLRKFFSEEEIQIMKEAVFDHRASLDREPRSIYGRIVSSADRNVELNLPFKRTFSYRMRLTAGTPIEEIIEESRLHLIDKFGKKGYSADKMYFEDEEYRLFLEELGKLTQDREAFKKKYI